MLNEEKRNKLMNKSEFMCFSILKIKLICTITISLLTRINALSFQIMDDYSTKIKNSAEHLIRNEFPEKALELDTLVSVCFICISYFLFSCIFLQSEVLSFNEVTKIRAEIQLPTADDIVAHLANGSKDQSHSAATANPNNNGSHAENSTTYVFNGTVPSNPLISILEDKLRPYILHFLDSVC